MGVYGSPELFPYPKDDKEPPKRKGKVLKIIIWAVVIYFLIGVGGNVLKIYRERKTAQRNRNTVSYSKEVQSNRILKSIQNETGNSASGQSAIDNNLNVTKKAEKELADARKPDLSKIDISKVEPRKYKYKSYDGRQNRELTQEKFPVGAAEYYRSLDRYNNVQEWKNYIDDPMNSKICEGLAKAFKQNGESDFDAVCNAIAFVQSLDYIPDNDMDYPKYPIETLNDKGGDCEDKSILLCGIIKAMGYGSALLIYDNHCAVGVMGTNLVGTHFEKDGKNYYFIETSKYGWRIGIIPEHYAKQGARVLKID